MPKGARRLLLAVLGIGLILGMSQIVWMPWVSPRYAASALADYDGKGFAIWIPAAARSWDDRLYGPLADATHQFDELRPSPQEVLAEILLGENAGNVVQVCEKLVSSRNPASRMIGFLAARKHGIDLRDSAALEAQVRRFAAQMVTTNDNLTILALHIVGYLGMPNMLPTIARQVQRDQVPSQVRKAACFALERLPEKAEAETLLTRLRKAGTCLDTPM